MTERRTIRLTNTGTMYEVCVVGEEIAIDVYRTVPRRADFFDVRGTTNIDVFMVYNSRAIKKPGKGEKWPIDKGVKVHISPNEPSRHLNDGKVKISYYISQGSDPVSSIVLYVTSVAISLDVDVNRIGFVSRGMKNKDTWTWGPNGRGAILLVNCDRDRNSSGLPDNEDSEGTPNAADVKDMSPMFLTAEGPDEIFDDYRVILEIEPCDSKRLRVYRQGKFQFKHVLGMGKLGYEVQRKNRDEMKFYVEGLQFPDTEFSGLVYVKVKLQRTQDLADIFLETVVFRVAPWIMTPNTQKPMEVYVSNVDTNEYFIKLLKEFVRKSRTTLIVCTENGGDRWMQDEMEFGYTEAPHKRFPVVLDSPRDRGLKDFPQKKVLGPDFGYVTRKANPDEIGSLDAFGNLEVSPPVTVNGKCYPLGRILYGGSLNDPALQMNKTVTDFLKGQQVQSPVQLYSTWLFVGHIDEFMSFVPAADKRGFRLVLASPRVCLDLFREKQKEGFGDAVMFEGVDKDKLTIDEILEDESLKECSQFCQECIDINRQIMKNKLGLIEADIIDIPILYKCDTPKKDAESFFPDMVNMLVLGNHLGIPKPFGPKINGKCCLEEKVQSLLEPLGLTCHFLDDFASYHKYLGEIHCGTNVVRKPFNFKWWHCEP